MEGISLFIRIRNYAICFILALILRRNGTVNRRLLNFIEYLHSLLPTPRYGVAVSDHLVDPARNLWFRAYSPVAAAGPLPVIVYFHGGGFAIFSPKTKFYDDFCRRLAGELPAVVLSVNYRLAPEHRYPCQYDDGFDVVRHIDVNGIAGGDDLRCNLRRFFIAGDSAGGNLAHHVAVRVSGFDFKRIRVRGLVSIQPYFGGEERTESEIRMGGDGSLLLTLRSTDLFWKAFLPVGSDRNHPAAHVFGPEAVELAGVEYPPTLLFIVGRDLLLDWQRQYHDWLIGSGKTVRVVEYPNMFHFCFVIAGLTESTLLVDEIRKFIRTLEADSPFVCEAN